MSDGRASKVLDDLLAVLLEDAGPDKAFASDPSAQAEMKAIVVETSALIAKLHRERTMRRLAEAEQERRRRALARPVKTREEPLPSKEQLIAELRGLMQAAGREAAFHAMKFQDSGAEDIAEMIASLRHLLEGKDE
jgi:hypothetical protein